MGKSTSSNSSSAGHPAHRAALSWAFTVIAGLAIGALGLYVGLAIITGDGDGNNDLSGGTGWVNFIEILQ